MRKICVLMAVSLLWLVIGCAKRITISYNNIEPSTVIKIKTKTGKTCEGLVYKKSPSFLVLQSQQKNKKLTKLMRGVIDDVSTHSNYVYDAENKIISEKEIEKTKKNTNFLLYTFGGAGLSFGTSFFAGSLLKRSINESNNGEKAMWATTIVGTTIGTLLFSRAGSKRDRSIAIEKIREHRYELAKKRAEDEKLKRKKVLTELNRIKQERKKQEEEIRQLQNKVNKNKKKKYQ